MLPTAPPAQRRRSASADEAAALTRALGARARLGVHDTAALLDPRGHRFQRLEWLGDSLLDHITAHHRLLAAGSSAPCCAGRSHADLVSDDDLAATVRGSGVLALLDWEPSPHRQADLVEACVAAAWLAGGWPDAVAVSATLVHGAFAADLRPLLHGNDPELPEPACSSVTFRRAATLGSYVLESAASLHLVAVDPGDEGRLSTRRRPLLAGRRLLGRPGRGPGACRTGALDHRVDHVQAEVGLVQLRGGAARAVTVAQALLRG